MKRDISIRLLGALCFIFIIISIIGIQSACASERAPVKIKMLSAPFGTGSYAMGSALEKLTAMKHSWLRIICTESPGYAYNVKVLAEDSDLWKSSIIQAGHCSIAMAEHGAKPIFEKAYDVNKFQQLVGFFKASNYLAKLGDPATAEDLNGKRIGLGKASQTTWSITPRAVLEHGYSIRANYSYLGPSPATQALLDGRVDAATYQVYSNGDQTIIGFSPAVRELEASGRKFSLIGLDAEMVSKASKKIGWEILSSTLPPNSLSPAWQPNALPVLANITGFVVHESFPEDIAYEFTKFVLEHYKEVSKYAPMGKFWDMSSLTMWHKLQRHAGARKAFKEKGISLDK